MTLDQIDIKDDDSALNSLQFSVLSAPKIGHLEHLDDAGKRVVKFTYEDLALGRIQYVSDEAGLRKWSSLKEDLIDLKVSDGKNHVSTTLVVSVQRKDNKMPVLRSTFSLKARELHRTPITANEIQVSDEDTPDELLKIIVTHPPQYGRIEKINPSTKDSIEDKHILINTSLNQTLNLILKFNRNNSEVEKYKTITEFTVAELKAGLISYNHHTTGSAFDRFGFVIFDGFNTIFAVQDAEFKVSNPQVFSITILPEKNQAPKIDRNLGLNYLYRIDGFPLRFIMRNELLVVDKDDPDSSIVFEITSPPTRGVLESKDRPGFSLARFTQTDINQNKVYYKLKQADDSVTSDFFLFDVHDSVKNVVRQNRFEIKWSVVSFETDEISVMEEEGKVRVHIKKEGNLKQFSLVTCKTISDSAKSNRDSKQFDFVHTLSRIEFNEDESYKACDVVLQRDGLVEPIESFYVLLEDPKNSMIGSRGRVRVNILDKKKGSYFVSLY